MLLLQPMPVSLLQLLLCKELTNLYSTKLTGTT